MANKFKGKEWVEDEYERMKKDIRGMNTRRLYYVIALVVLSLAILDGCRKNSEKELPSGTVQKKEAALIPADNRRMMPDFNLTSIQDGSTVNSNNFPGRISVVAIFSPWCSDCVSEMGMLQKFRDAHPADFSAVGMAVVDQDTEKELKPFIKNLKLKLPVVESDEALEKAFGGIIIVPTAYLIDKKGRIARKYIRHLTKDRLSTAFHLLQQESRFRTRKDDGG